MKILLSVIFVLTLCAPCFADVTIQNKSERIIEANVTDSKGNRKSVTIPSKEKFTIETGQSGGKLEIKAIGNKETGEILGAVKFTDDTLVVVTSDKNDPTKINIKKSRKY